MPSTVSPDSGTPVVIGRRRTLLVVGSVAVVALLLPIGLLAVVITVTDDGTAMQPPDLSPPLLPAPPLTPPDGWDVMAQTELATRPMLRLPESAAWPQPLTEQRAGSPVELPRPAGPMTQPATQFPPTAEGAIAQLAELTRVGLEGGDPAVYRRTYAAIALPGAPPPESARLYRDLRRVRAGVLGLPPTGPVDDMVFAWTPTSALVKGTADGSRYVVVCVLGELVTGLNGQSIATGAGDCQALRRVEGRWWISPGAAAAPAPLAWPGSADAVRAGYRSVRS